jgi:PEGA domain
MTIGAMKIYPSLLVACLVLAVVAAIAGQAHAQPAPKPFTKDDVVQLLKGNVPAKRVEALVRERGIDFPITPETESELRKAGATGPLLVILRDLAPKPPTLVVTTTPGGAQVFVDDELIARTSADGRLKILTLAPGPHKLRVSLDGYRDYEKSVDLVARETQEVPIPLEPNSQTGLPAAQPESADVSGEPGAARAGPSSPSMSDTSLKIPGFLDRQGVFAHIENGTLTIGNGKLRFTPASEEQGPLDMNLSDIVPVKQSKVSVKFQVRQQKTKRYEFWPNMHDKAANEQAAKELFEALMAGSK